MTDAITYRTAIPTDADRIARLHARSWQRAYRGIMTDHFLDHDVEAERLAVWQARFREPAADRRVILAEVGDELVGFACVEAREDPTYGALLDNLHVAHEYQGRSIGRELIRQAARWIAEQDSDASFYLWVYEQNHPARKFYEGLGAINQERISDEVGVKLRYVWPRVGTLTQ